jgi:DNA repair exonuclease SbcCD ATPase subunit
MKIIELRAENIKRLVAVTIRPEGNIVELTGRNGQGKSSVLDAMWWAFEGAKHIQSVPIRKGATEAFISLDLGDLKITRTFKSKDEGFTTSIVVEQANGARFQKPQTVIDTLLGELTFDPLAFTRMKPQEQLDTLKQFVPGVDFAEIERLHNADFAKRTDVNRKLRDMAAQIASIVIPAGAPTAEVDEAALIADLEKAGETNADIERLSAGRAAYAKELERAISRLSSVDTSIEELKSELAEREKERATLQAEIDERQEKLKNVKPLQQPVDTAKVREAISAAKIINAQYQAAERAKQNVIRLTAERKALEEQADALTLAMEARATEKAKAISEAKMPIDGIGFGDGTVLLDGLPFEQASDAQRLRASIAIAAAMNPKLRVIRVRDGSLLDDDAMTMLAEFAEASDFQIWIERVDSTGRVGFVLEDGNLKVQENA